MSWVKINVTAGAPSDCNASRMLAQKLFFSATSTRVLVLLSGCKCLLARTWRDAELQMCRSQDRPLPGQSGRLRNGRSSNSAQTTRSSASIESCEEWGGLGIVRSVCCIERDTGFHGLACSGRQGVPAQNHLARDLGASKCPTLVLASRTLCTIDAAWAGRPYSIH